MDITLKIPIIFGNEESPTTSVHARFKRFGEIIHLTMRTRGLFQYAYIKYSSSDGIAHFYNHTWSETLGHDIVRVLPLTLSQEEPSATQKWYKKGGSMHDKSFNSNQALKAQFEEFRKSLQDLYKMVTSFANDIKALKSKINSSPQFSSSSSNNKGPNKCSHITSSSEDNSPLDQERCYV
ncbi:hypothetical protein C1645_831998 [Glomus cerebriforme]|uniref:RRM domain-containing protein n=1 Tax=Glomus cerebriforme TaxID=658196 RepID=A0A397SEE3_9GLOM|nr:hypothetical protein C1645_831998 [Glomus cerebriforme]